VTEPATNSRLKVLICLVLGLITLLLYLPSLRHDFLSYDDQQYVTENAQVKAGLTWEGFAWSFGYHAGNWHPLAWLSHMLDCQLYSLNPAGHHLTNVLLHVANTVLLFLVLARMTGSIWRSASVAALFGWHPLHVESVAWVAERKDLLCACFWILTTGVYVRYAQARRMHDPKSTSWYGMTVILFGFALMSKPMAVTLPFTLLLLDCWPLERLETDPGGSRLRPFCSVLSEKIPLFVLSGITCVLTMSAQELAIVSTAGLSIPQRISHALGAYAHYAAATAFPHRLAVYYPYEAVLPAGQIILAGAFVLAITCASLGLLRRHSFIGIGWFWFVGTLVPVIGFVQVGDQAWADRYTYLPSIGLFVIVVWGAVEGVRQRQLLTGIAALTGLALLISTTLQLRHWQNTRTLFTHTAQVIPNNYMAITMLGSLLARENKLDEAIVDYRTALRLQPGFPEAHFFLGNALDQQGKLDEAIAEYRQALWFKPIMETTHILLGVALGKKQQPDEAVAHFLAAIKINPESAIAHNNLARIRHTQGLLDEAIDHYSRALKLDPQLAQAHNNLGILLLQRGRLAEGTAALREGLRLNSTNTESQLNLALALNQQAQWAEAAGLFAKIVNPAFRDANAHYQFALALEHLGKTREAMSRYANALLLQPDLPEALNGLAWILATTPNADFRNAAQALGMAQRACDLTGKNQPRFLKTLAAAYAEAGSFAQAIATVEEATTLPTADQDTVAECRLMLAAFKSNRAWRASP